VRPFLQDKLGFLTRCAREYGPVVRLEIGGPTYLLSSPDDIRHVLRSTNYEKTARIIGKRARRFFGDGLVTRAGPEHLRQRRMLQPAFHRSVVETFASIMVSSAGELLDRWRPGSVIDAHECMLDLTQRVFSRSLIGSLAQSERERLLAAVAQRRQYQEYLLGRVLPIAEWLPTRRQQTHLRAERDIESIVVEAIRDRRATPRREAVDILQLLLDARYDDGSAMSDRQILDEVRTLTIAGYETIAEALSWTWFLLASHPDVEERAANEVAAVCRGRPPQAGDVPGLGWCRMILAESMRLYPPTWLFVRVAGAEDVLPGGARIPAGARIYLSQWVMHRHPDFFPEPDRFNPERFTETAIHSRPRMTYFPFGAGRRLCIGEEFAWMMGLLLMATVLGRFRLVMMPGQTILPDPNITLRPRGGIAMELQAR
jgi:cytochrome P450